MPNKARVADATVKGESIAMARGDEQSTMRVRREVQEKLKIIAAMESLENAENVSVFSLADRVLTAYIRDYESILGRPLGGRSKQGT